MPRAKRPTSREVAALAGVSVATVSYVINGRTDRRIPDVTRDRVIAAAQQLGYAPDRAARMLRRGSSEQVCLVVGSLGVPTLDELAQSLHQVGARHGFGLITMLVDSAAAAENAVSRLRERIADGIVIAPAIPYLSEEHLAQLSRAQLPMVVMSNSVSPDGFDVYREPEREAILTAIDHLHESGRQRIAYIAHEREHDSFAAGGEVSERLGAYLEGLRRQGAQAEPLVIPGADDRVAGYASATSLLTAQEPPDALFVASSRAAVSAIWAARDLRLRIPDDVAIIGSRAVPEASITRPTLSTVGPTEESNFADAAELLFDRITGSGREGWREVSHPWHFIARGSV